MRFGGSLLRSGLCVIALVFWSSVLFSADLRDLARLRSPDPLIAALMANANRRSMTFHELLEDIAHTDGLVYVETGHCGHGVRACVPHSITRSGPFRLLHILIDPHDARNAGAAEVSGIIAHELQHALEVLARGEDYRTMCDTLSHLAGECLSEPCHAPCPQTT